MVEQNSRKRTEFKSESLLGVHVDGSLAVFDRGVVVVQLGEGGGTVAVENLVGAIDLNGPKEQIFQVKIVE